MKYYFAVAALVISSVAAQAGQSRYLHSPVPVPQAIDVLHYRFALTLSDRSDTISGMAAVTLRTGQPATAIMLDLAGINAEGKGMAVTAVMVDDVPAVFTHTDNVLRVSLQKVSTPGVIQNLRVQYRGIPADGLIISTSLFKKRTFFGDNWPNRAHQWLPCHDVPSDKASVEFIITAPQHYSVVSNGIKTDETILPDSMKRTHWQETVPLPTKVMVIGAADFAVGDAGRVNNIPVSSWVYTELKEKGFADYARAKDILQYFIGYIGPYGYKKLANVQSKTIFGGMENASAIFYFEQSVTGEQKVEDLMAHEIAHQWFGNMVTETAYQHLWLSEGFATYLTDIYLESRYGTDSMNRRLQGERKAVTGFANRSPRPVIDTTADYMSLLNQNSYQKGAWILHMLRRTIGDIAFQRTLRTYYAKYAGGNASSADFAAVAENISGKKLGTFFKQWLTGPGIPRLQFSWTYNRVKKSITVEIVQVQDTLFSFPLELGIQTAHNTILKTIAVSKRKTRMVIPAGQAVTAVQPDPNTNLLWEWVPVQEQ